MVWVAVSNVTPAGLVLAKLIGEPRVYVSVPLVRVVPAKLAWSVALTTLTALTV